MKRIAEIISLVLLCIALMTGCVVQDEQPQVSSSSSVINAENTTPIDTTNLNSTLEVHYIDVGQADSSLVLCDGYSMLIDGGNAADSNLIAAYLKKENITSLDYIVCTHAHEDHVGGLSGALSVVEVKNVLAPKTEAETAAYQNFKDKTAVQGLTIQHPAAGDSFMLGSGNIQVVGPVTENTDDLNNTSIVMKLTYGSTSFLFTGDASRDEEQDIINAGYDISADVLKVGHHGSESSTSYLWLREVMPKYAIISVGKNNTYGHPSEAVLSRLRDADVTLYRTDLQGDIIVKSDGENITVTTERNENIETNETAEEYNEGTYIGNKNSKKFHRPDCRMLPAEQNRVEFSNREDAISSGYSPCGICNP